MKGDAPGKAAVDRPSHAEESRTIVQLAKTCFLATLSAELDGYPFGSVTDLACDEKGRPLFAISTMSGHTKDLTKDSRCSVTVQQPAFAGIQDGRVTLTGNVTKVRSQESIRGGAYHDTLQVHRAPGVRNTIRPRTQLSVDGIESHMVSRLTHDYSAVTRIKSVGFVGISHSKIFMKYARFKSSVH
jgi:hypothetical protein